MSSFSRGLVSSTTLLACLAFAGCGPDSGSPSRAATDAPSGTAELAKSRNAPIPAFSDSARVTNPYFPVSALGGYRLVGAEDGKRYKAYIKVQPGTKVINWLGGSTETLVARHESFLAGELIEVAVSGVPQSGVRPQPR